jgi:hypothetical protein
MGYTHHFGHKETSEPRWNLIVRDCKKLYDNLPADVEIAGWDGSGTPVFNGNRISFNGAIPNNHESFVLERFGPERREWDDGRFPFAFCKTIRKPYDLFVCACLLVYKRYSPDSMRLTSDGGPADWRDAEVFVKTVLQYEVSYFDYMEGS